MLSRMEIERCSLCGVNLALTGRRHHCIPKSGGAKGKPQDAAGPKTADGVTRAEPRGGDHGTMAKITKKPKPVLQAADAGSAPSPRAFRKPLAKDAAKSLMATKPWLVEGMSRATWYRIAAVAKKARQAEKKGK